MSDEATMTLAEVRTRFEAAGQGHVLRFVDEMADAERARFLERLAAIDLERVGRAWQSSAKTAGAGAGELDELPARSPDPAERERLFQLGEEHIRRGEVAVLTVAGGDGTRLGFDAPKGCYPISPVRGATLAQLFAEGIAATRERSGAEVPWVLMTSERTDEALREHLHSFEGWLGGREPFRTMRQGAMPVLDAEGRIVLAARDRPAMAPDGHGGALAALVGSGVLDRLRQSGVRILFYHQVDNPLGMRPCPLLVGLHVDARAQATTKVVRKTDPAERVGVVCRRDGRPAVVEYSELSEELAQARREDGHLRFDAANLAVHTFDVELLADAAGDPLPFHRAFKKVACVGDDGLLRQPTEPNAFKLESFIFDLLPRCDRYVSLEVERAEEFHPLKGADGEFSPEGVRRALSRMWAGWLVARGYSLPAGVAADGSSPVEISPRVARRAEELPVGLELDVDASGGLLVCPEATP